MSEETLSIIANTPVEQRDPRKLKLAEENKRFIRLEPGTSGYALMFESMRERGIDHPLLIDKDGYVYDGWTRREIAVDLQMKSVPVKVCITKENAHDMVWASNFERKNMTLGQKAYCIVPSLEAAFQEALTRRSLNASKTKATELLSFSTREEMVVKYGINHEYLRQARVIHKLFAENPDPKKYGDSKKPVTLRDYIHPRISDMDAPMKLGDAIKAIGYLLSAAADDGKKTGGKPKDAQIDKQLTLFNRLVTDGFTRWEYYTKWTDKVKEEHWETVRLKAATRPAQELLEKAEYHKKLARELEKIAKKEGK